MVQDMLRSYNIPKAIAVFLVMVVFMTMVNSLAASRASHASPGPVLTVTVSQSVTPESSIPVKDDFKPPKQSFVDYDIFFSCVELKPMNRPEATFHNADSGTRALSGVLPEILIPPKI